MNFKDIKQHTQDEFNIINFNNHEIKILKYLPIEDKFDLIMTAIQKSYSEGIYNPIRLRVFFNLNIVYLYTDIEFDIDDRMNEGALYDNLLTSGLLYAVTEAIEEDEMTSLTRLLDKTLEVETAYRNTAAAIISKIVDDLPKNAEAARKTIDEIDSNKYDKAIALARDLAGEIKSK
jgi:hypothetical protein